MQFKTIKTITTAVLLPLWLYAHTPSEAPGIVQVINASGNISINQPEAMTARLTKTNTSDGEVHTEAQTEIPKSHSGYRIQIYDDNNPRTARSNAEAYNAQIAAHFSGMRTYVSFNSPYWQVKAGDFRSRAEAEAMMAEIRYAFPGLAPYLRIIRDRINLTD